MPITRRTIGPQGEISLCGENGDGYKAGGDYEADYAEKCDPLSSRAATTVLDPKVSNDSPGSSFGRFSHRQ
ncbi:hypothetical protein CMI41_03875 [Candidatus Pacearchaeota archaeon]|nr:hypothetical protein [Candidatus Pacearchaeota archaeon]